MQGKFNKGDTVVLADKQRKCLPHELRSHDLFKLMETCPPRCPLFAKGKEPTWAVIQPCDADGRVARQARKVKIGLSWLNPALTISPESSSRRRHSKLLEFTQDKHRPDITEHRILVRLGKTF